MALKVGGTIVINDSRALENISNLKTVGGSAILGTGDIPFPSSAPSSHVGATGTAHGVATTSVAGFMSSADKTKLDGIQSGATAYTHPANHLASIITQDANNRFVTDDEKTNWNSKQPAGSYVTANSAVTFSSINGISFSRGQPGNLNNLAIGTNVLNSNYSSWNCAIGQDVLANNLDGYFNTGIGFCLVSNTRGFDNTAVGQNALSANTTGSSNVALGSRANSSNITGQNNVSVGVNSLRYNNNGNNNVAVGFSSLTRNVSSNNIAIGAYSLDQINSQYANCNTAIGDSTLRNSTNGAWNVAIGYDAARTNIGQANCAVGTNALNAVSGNTGSNNTVVGTSAGTAITSGSGNVVLGSIKNDGFYSPCFDITSQNNHVVIGSSVVTNAYIQVAWTVVSDARDKTNFAAIPHGLDFVKQLKPTAYQFRESRESEATNGGVRYGFKAQDIAAIEPEAVIVDTTNPDKLYYNESNLVPVLVKAIQELSAEVERLKAKAE